MISSIRISIIILWMTQLLSCSSPEPQWTAELRFVIQNGSKATPAKFMVKDITNFAWDQMFVFGPYTPIGEIEKALGTTTWSPARESGIESSDTFCLLVFVSQKRIVEYSQFNRSSGDFSPVSSTTPYTRSNAVFSVHLDPSGWITVQKSKK